MLIARHNAIDNKNLSFERIYNLRQLFATALVTINNTYLSGASHLLYTAKK